MCLHRVELYSLSYYSPRRENPLSMDRILIDQCSRGLRTRTLPPTLIEGAERVVPFKLRLNRCDVQGTRDFHPCNAEIFQLLLPRSFYQRGITSDLTFPEVFHKCTFFYHLHIVLNNFRFFHRTPLFVSDFHSRKPRCIGAT